tara:strand:+ start:847 stop:1113 length:267 start_codon:yes stop_codon:yes gene_type:complete
MANSNDHVDQVKKFDEAAIVDQTILITKLMENCAAFSEKRGDKYAKELKSQLATLASHEAQHIKAPTTIQKKVEVVIEDLSIHLPDDA